MDRMTREKVTLVLGGGGGRGLAHIGAWRAMQELGVRPARVIASSAGALVGACIAAGMSWSELARQARALTASSLFSVNPRLLSQGTGSPGLLREEPLRHLIRAILPVTGFEELDVPLSVNAVALGTGRLCWFGEEPMSDPPLVDAIYASCALPLVFPPAELDGERYVDGGLMDPVPVGHARELASDPIVAVEVVPPRAPAEQASGMVDTYCRVLEVLRDRSAPASTPDLTADLARVQVVVDRCHTLDFTGSEALIDSGYRATLSVLSEPGHPVSTEAAATGGRAPRDPTPRRRLLVPPSLSRIAWAR